MSGHHEPVQLSPELEELNRVRHQFEGMMLEYKFGIDEIMTKLNILREEFSHRNDYSPIEHVSCRLKSPESILAKAVRKGLEPTIEQIVAEVHDIAGVRVTCSFISDAYRVFDMIAAQDDISVLQVRDYIAEPKENGYQSLHMLVEVPVFLSERVHKVKVEVQIRTIAMDFWASLEHKIYYKYDGDVPESLLAELRDAAATASRLDVTMERLHDDVKALGTNTDRYIDPRRAGTIELPDSLLRTFWPQADAADPVPALVELPPPGRSEV
ncbi:GTP pyrophosphokinase [Microterricola pindariensis]|nr:GTP pyrophosphokinase family protein [Microterricola pindariensis]